MRLVLLGPPGVGKGTQAVKLSEHLNIPHISTGDMFREAISKKTELGLLAKEYMDSGKLVPNEITIGLVRDRLLNSDCNEGFILDGFPRDLAQAKALEGILKNMNVSLSSVIYIDAGTETVVNRIAGRRVCKGCGTTYHVTFRPPPEDGKCPECGCQIHQRADDSEDTVIKRLKVYEALTQPLVDYYKNAGILNTVDGEKESDIVLNTIITMVQGRK